jgi:hypothetical protein
VLTSDQVRRPATTVLFDPELDLAVLFVRRSPWPVLPLTGEDAERGDTEPFSVPGGGPLWPRRRDASRHRCGGHDIYGEARSTARSSS